MSDAAAPAVPVKSLRRWLRPVATKKVGQYIGALSLWLALLFLAHRFARLRGADTDLWPRWYGLRALLIDGRDPYDVAVSIEIAARTALAAAPEAARAAYGFIYPLPGALMLAPLAALPYDWAAATWLALGIPALAASGLLALQSLGQRPERDTELLAIPLVLANVPALWNLALIQPGLLVVFLLALAVWAARLRPFVAGLALASAALLKPQMAAPLALSWALYDCARWRRPAARRALAGMAVAALTLNGFAIVLLPHWPLSFLDALRAYGSAPEMHPLSPALHRLASLLPLHAPLAGTASALLTAVGAGTLALWAVDGWRRDSAGVAALPARGIARSMVAGALVVPPAWETNALVLIVPLAGVMGQLKGRAVFWFVGASVALSVALAPLPLVLPWRSGAVVTLAYVALWAGATSWLSTTRQKAARSAPAAGVA